MHNVRKSGTRVILGGASLAALIIGATAALAQGNPNYSFFPSNEAKIEPVQAPERAGRMAEEAPAPVSPPVAPPAAVDVAGEDPAEDAPTSSVGAAVNMAEEIGEIGEDAVATAAAANDDDRETKDDAIDRELAKAVRSLPEGVEPLSSSEMRRLEQFGVIARQADLGEDILIMDRELKRAQAIDSLIALMGVDGFKATYPELYSLLESSPIILRAEIQRHTLLGELKLAEAGPVPEEPAEAVEQRDDGSSFFRMPDPIPAPVANVPPPVAAPSTPSDALAPPVTVAESAPPIVDTPISLREVYGLEGDLYAVIMHGEERIRVSAGDVLPGETVIEAVGDGYIDIIRRGEEIRIRIRG